MTMSEVHSGIAAWTCHQPSSVFDVVPGDLVSSTILAAAAAITQASHMLPSGIACLITLLSAFHGKLCMPNQFLPPPAVSMVWLFTCY